MKTALALVFTAALAVTAYAGHDNELNNIHSAHVKGYARLSGGGSNVTFHTGGTVIRHATVVLIFWGAIPSAYATELQNFRNQFGTTPEYNTITQYYGNDTISGYGNIAQGSLINQADWFDTSTPPTNVTDSIVQSEVKKYISSHGV